MKGGEKRMSFIRDLITMKGVVTSEIVDNWIDESHDREEDDLEDLVINRISLIKRISECLSLTTIKEIWFEELWSDRSMFEERWKELKKEYVIKTEDS